MCTEIIFGDVETLHEKFAFIKNAIAIVKACFARTQGFDLRSAKYHAGNISSFEEIVVISLAVTDFQTMFFCKDTF